MTRPRMSAGAPSTISVASVSLIDDGDFAAREQRASDAGAHEGQEGAVGGALQPIAAPINKTSVRALMRLLRNPTTA